MTVVLFISVACAKEDGSTIIAAAAPAQTTIAPSVPAPPTPTCVFDSNGDSVNSITNIGPCTLPTDTCGSQANLIYSPSSGQWLDSSGQRTACSIAELPTTSSLGYGGPGYGGLCGYWSSVYPGMTFLPGTDPSINIPVCILQ